MLSLAHKLGQLYGHFHIEQNEEDSSTIKTDSLQIRLHLQRSDFCKLALRFSLGRTLMLIFAVLFIFIFHNKLRNRRVYQS